MTRYDFCSFKDENGLSVVTLKNKFGIYDFYNGKEIIPPTYDEIHILDGNFFAIKVGKNYGVVDRNNQIVASVRFKGVFCFDDEHLCLKNHDNTQQLLCKKTRKTSKHYSLIYDFKDGFAFVVKDEALGVIDKNLKEVIPTKYSHIIPCKNDTFFTTSGTTICLVDSTNNVIKTLPYEVIYQHKTNNMKCFLVRIGNLYGLIDSDLNEIVPVKYNCIRELFGNFLTIMSEKSTRVCCGVYHIGKGVIIEPSYVSVGTIGLDLLSVENYSGKLAVFNSAGKQLTDFIYDGLGSTGNFVFVQIEDPNNEYEYLTGLLDTDGNVVLEPIYDDIESKGCGYVVYKDGKCGVCDENAKLVSEIMFDDVRKINTLNKCGYKFAEVAYNGEEGNYFW